MPTCRARVTSLGPPLEVFDYLAPFSNAAEWDQGVTAAIEHDPGSPAVVSTHRLMVRSLGRAIPRDRAMVGLRAVLGT